MQVIFLAYEKDTAEWAWDMQQNVPHRINRNWALIVCRLFFRCNGKTTKNDSCLRMHHTNLFGFVLQLVL